MRLTRRALFMLIAGATTLRSASRRTVRRVLNLHGIPYCHNDASTGPWLGLDRNRVDWVNPSSFGGDMRRAREAAKEGRNDDTAKD